MLYNFYNMRINEAHNVCTDFCEYTQLIWELLHEKFIWELGQVHICQCHLPLAMSPWAINQDICWNSSFILCLSPFDQNFLFFWNFLLKFLNLFYIPPTVFPCSSPPVLSPSCFLPLTSTPQKSQGLLWESTKHGILSVKIFDSWLTVHICELITKQFRPVSFYFNAKKKKKRMATKGSVC